MHPTHLVKPFKHLFEQQLTLALIFIPAKGTHKSEAGQLLRCPTCGPHAWPECHALSFRESVAVAKAALGSPLLPTPPHTKVQPTSGKNCTMHEGDRVAPSSSAWITQPVELPVPTVVSGNKLHQALSFSCLPCQVVLVRLTRVTGSQSPISGLASAGLHTNTQVE